MKIGIIAAEPEEMNAIKEKMTYSTKQEYFDLQFYEGEINGKRCTLVECGVGKVNAARTTQILIDRFYVDCVINVGSAGAANDQHNVGDIIIANKLIQYDFDVSDIGNYEKGEVCGVGKYFFSNDRLVYQCEQAIKEISSEEYKASVGSIGTADQFCSKPELSKKINDEFGVECLEMEGAAVGQVCTQCKIPFIVIRGISDTPNGNNKVDFHTYLELASKRAALIVEKLINKL